MISKKLNTAVIINLLIFVITAVIIVTYFTGTGEGNMQVHSFACFRFFTTLSNVYAAIASLTAAVWMLKAKSLILPCWLFKFHFSAAAAVTLTMLTCLFFLGPTEASNNGIAGYFSLFLGPRIIFLHLITPVAVLAMLFCSHQTATMRKIGFLWGVPPFLAYALLYIRNVLITKAWPDFYGLTFGGSSTAAVLSCIVMTAATLGISAVLWFCKRKILLKQQAV